MHRHSTCSERPIVALFIFCLVAASLGFQCPPPQPPSTCLAPPSSSCDPLPYPPPCDCFDICYVCTEAELRKALDCYANGNGCCHIVVPEDVVITTSSPFTLGSCHTCLHLTINGIVQWTGPAGFDYSAIFSLDGTSNITIDGTGRLRSDYSAVDNEYIADGVVLNVSHNITINGLSFRRLSNMVRVNETPCDNLTLTNLTGGHNQLPENGMSQYGIFLAGNGATVTNCHVYGADNQHGFRFYVSNLSVTNCSSYESGSSGLWAVEGDNITINGFTSDKYLRLGPNFACLNCVGEDTGQRLRNADVRGIDVEYVQVELGTMGCYLEGVTGSRYQDWQDSRVRRPLVRRGLF